MFALNMTVMALELATEDPDYEDIAIQTYQQFLAIANAIGGHAGMGLLALGRGGGVLQGPDHRSGGHAPIASTSIRWSA